MSRLFDALQQYVAETSGVPFPPAPSVATELLQSAERKERILGNVPKLRISPSDRMVSLGAEHSLAAEKFRFLAVRLRYLQQRASLKKVLITSTIAEEGKSFVSINLALTLARKQHQKVLLIEGDLRRPGVAHEFGLPPLSGLCESLADGNDGLRNMVYLEQAKIWFIPAGTPPENPLELMQSNRLPELMNEISAWFDWVVIDSPPVLPLADTTVWSRLVDGTLLVTREGKTQKRELTQGLQVLDKSNILGVVINGSTSTDSDNYYQRYGYHAQPQQTKNVSS
jgi:capsular exopolysaccharide synthesis family protein